MPGITATKYTAQEALSRAINSEGSAFEVVSEGVVADDVAASGNPLPIGGQAKAFDGTDPGSVAEGDRVEFISDLNRRLNINQAHPNGWVAITNRGTGATPIIKATPGAALSLHITDILFSNIGTAGTIVLQSKATPTSSTVELTGRLNLPATGAPTSIQLVQPIRLAANHMLLASAVALGQHSITINGYTAP